MLYESKWIRNKHLTKVSELEEDCDRHKPDPNDENEYGFRSVLRILQYKGLNIVNKPQNYLTLLSL